MSSNSNMGNLLNLASIEGKDEVVSKLIEDGASVQQFGPVGLHPLHLASMNGHTGVCRVLVNAGAMINIKNKVGKTALHFAAVNGHEELVDYLISVGAIVDSCDMLGMTPLHWACDRGHTSIVKSLLCSGADPNRPNRFWKSPSVIAQEKKHCDLVDMIKDNKGCHRKRESSGLSTNHRINEKNNFSSENFCSVTECITDMTNDTDETVRERSPIKDSVEIVMSEDEEENSSESAKMHFFNSNKCSFHRENIYDEESMVQDKLLNSLNKLEETVPSLKLSDNELNQSCEIAAAELLRAQAALISLEDPSRMLRRAIYLGQTIQLTEAGERALAMIRPEPFIIRSDDKRKAEKESNDKQLSSKAECNAIVLRQKQAPHSATRDDRIICGAIRIT